MMKGYKELREVLVEVDKEALLLARLQNQFFLQTVLILITIDRILELPSFALRLYLTYDFILGAEYIYHLFSFTCSHPEHTFEVIWGA